MARAGERLKYTYTFCYVIRGDIMVKIQDVQTGNWLFVLGIALVLLFGSGLAKDYTDVLIGALFAIGLVVGFLNITAEEATPYMYAGLVLVLVSYFGVGIIEGASDAKLVMIIVGLLKGILLLFVPLTLSVSLKSVFAMARSK